MSNRFAWCSSNLASKLLFIITKTHFISVAKTKTKNDQNLKIEKCAHQILCSARIIQLKVNKNVHILIRGQRRFIAILSKKLRAIHRTSFQLHRCIYTMGNELQTITGDVLVKFMLIEGFLLEFASFNKIIHNCLISWLNWLAVERRMREEKNVCYSHTHSKCAISVFEWLSCCNSVRKLMEDRPL